MRLNFLLGTYNYCINFEEEDLISYSFFLKQMLVKVTTANEPESYPHLMSVSPSKQDYRSLKQLMNDFMDVLKHIPFRK